MREEGIEHERGIVVLCIVKELIRAKLKSK
jgi:hypothetical protein